MSDHPKIELKKLTEAVKGGAAALRCVTELQPAGGAGDKVFPPTYEGGKYAEETRLIDGRQTRCVILDSVASQANRIELALLRAWKRGKFKLPIVQADFTEFPDLGYITSLETPHRIADSESSLALSSGAKAFAEPRNRFRGN